SLRIGLELGEGGLEARRVLPYGRRRRRVTCIAARGEELHRFFGNLDIGGQHLARLLELERRLALGNGGTRPRCSTRILHQLLALPDDVFLRQRGRGSDYGNGDSRSDQLHASCLPRPNDSPAVSPPDPADRKRMLWSRSNDEVVNGRGSPRPF